MTSSTTSSTYALDQNYHKTPPFHHHIDIPPRKLNFTFSPKFTNPNFVTTLARENSDEDPDDPYSSDYFRMYEFKVRKCTRSRSHDWTDCPFAHPGEKARRRDPRQYNYSGEICPDFRLTGGGGGGACAKGERCEFSHGVFECWLHPDRYRTEPCKDGVNCTRKVCFFAHTPQQLRFPQIITPTEKKLRKNAFMANSKMKKKHCCKCVYCLHNSINNVSSPTSTLTGAPHFSPPASPSPPLSPVFRKFGDKLSDSVKCDLLKKYCYEDVVNEMLMSSMEAINVSGNGLLVDVSKDQELDFSGYNQHCCPSGMNRDFFNGGSSNGGFDDGKLSNENGLSCPDLGWVNDLLM